MSFAIALALLLLVAQPGAAQEAQSTPEIEASLRAEVRLRASLRERRSEEERARERAARYAPSRVDAAQRVRSADVLADQQRVREQTRSSRRIEAEIDRAAPDVDRERLRNQLRSENRRSDFEARIDRLDRTLRRANSPPTPSRVSPRTRPTRPSPGGARLPAY